MFRASKGIVLLFAVFLFPKVCFAQDLDFIRGKVLDKETNEPVVFATVRILGKAKGIITNMDGSFRLPQEYREAGESIVISFMGYTKKEYALQNLSPKDVNIIILTPSSFELSEAVVSAKVKKINARDIVRYAIDNIPQNYSLEQFGLVGYYRDYQIENENYTNMNEAIIKIFDAGFASKDNFDNEYQLITYKKNLEFKIDSFTKQPYDYEKHSKIIPSAKM